MIQELYSLFRKNKSVANPVQDKKDSAWPHNDFTPSKEAQEQGVCHTREECRALYGAIPLKQREGGARALHAVLCDSDLDAFIAGDVHKDGDYYDILPQGPGAALFFGMGIRNTLRRLGYGERELDVHNLDCVYEYFLRDAVKIEVDRRAKYVR